VVAVSEELLAEVTPFRNTLTDYFRENFYFKALFSSYGRKILMKEK
jgi:hypothetical protein